jgi:hypothetical protein
MGSSILASLSQAGGNDPHRVVSKPLPPRSLRFADRVVRNATRTLTQSNYDAQTTDPLAFGMSLKMLNMALYANPIRTARNALLGITIPVWCTASFS